MGRSPIRLRPTIRLRLTAVFGALFIATSLVLITIAYVFVADRTGRGGVQPNEARLRAALVTAGIERPERPNPGRPPGGFPGRTPQLPAEVEQALAELNSRSRQRLLDELLTQSLVAFGITATGSLALAWFMAGRALAPVDAITDTANRLSEENLHERLADHGPDDELHRLRASFNGMLGRLETAFEARRRLAADASHELRTPLAVMRAKADNRLTDADASPCERDLASDFITQIDRADRLVTQLLTLAQAEDRRGARHVVDLAGVVGDAVGELAADADRRGLDLQLTLGDAWVSGDDVLLERLVSNVVRNAIVHNRDGGWLGVEVGRHDGCAVLRVANSGPVVDEREVDRLFDRFQQGTAAASRHGHGLGLAIVRAVADAHDARVDVQPVLEGGLVVAVSFPAVDPPDTC